MITTKYVQTNIQKNTTFNCTAHRQCYNKDEDILQNLDSCRSLKMGKKKKRGKIGIGN